MNEKGKQPRLLGIAGSLRNARWGKGNETLIAQLCDLPTKEALFEYLETQSSLRLESFLQAGRSEGKDFSEIYRNLKKRRSDAGLSNSETALAAGLWAAHQKGVAIDHLSLAEFFPDSGRVRDLETLRNRILAADGLLISGPVYFGDRGSLAESLITLLRQDQDLREHMAGRLYAGIAVGAKRNGGQETCLIYQMLDMLDLGFLCVGNDSDTTSQYGGTGHAGDVGQMHKDTYGLKTSMGTGYRIGRLMMNFNNRNTLKGPVRLLFLMLQDAKGVGRRHVESLLQGCREPVSAEILNIHENTIRRCIACDICPTHIDRDEVYRCIIKHKEDDFQELHSELLNFDAIIPVTAADGDPRVAAGNYQVFLERTRYLRRGDYLFSDLLVAPMSFLEVGINNYHTVRMVTSLIRHHTVMSKPMVGYLHQGNWLNEQQMSADFSAFLNNVRRLTIARLSGNLTEDCPQYNPVGYVLSADKEKEDQRLKKRAEATRGRHDLVRRQTKERLADEGQ